MGERAARFLGLPDTSASDDNDGNGPDSDPPYCYFESSTLTFNQDATNTGGCSTSDVCLCTLGSGTQGNAESFAFLTVDSKEGGTIYSKEGGESITNNCFSTRLTLI